MNICVFNNYKVKVEGQYSQYTEGDFITEEINTELNNIDGRTLFDKIKRELNDRKTISFGIENDKVYIEKFDPFSGESEDYSYTITAIGE